MDLSGPKTVVGRPAATHHAMGREGAGKHGNAEPIAHVGTEVVAPPRAAALERLTAAATSGRLDRAGLQALRDGIETARRTHMAARQISRSGLGGRHPLPQRGDLAQALRTVLAQRSRESAWLGIEPRQSLRLAQVMIDASMLATLRRAPLDWCVEHEHSLPELGLAVGVEASWAHARLQRPFAQRPPEPVAAPAANGLPSNSTTLDGTACRPIERLTQTKRLVLHRDTRAGRAQLTLEFPRTVGDSLPVLTPHAPEPAPAPWANSQPMAVRHVRVVAARRETGRAVHTTLRAMALPILDFVASVSEVRARCVHGLAHAIVCQAALAVDRFQRVRATWSATAPKLTLVEITEQGRATEVGDPLHGRTTHIGRDGVAEALGKALVHESSAAA
jgi:hypothetical protein